MNVRLIVYALLVVVMAVAWGSSCVLFRFAQMNAQIAPLEDRVFEQMTVVTVGTGGDYENPARRGPCTAVGLGTRVVLVDAGRGIAEGLRLAGIPVSQPDTLLLTNLLPTNTVGLDDLLLTGWLARREQPLRVIGPTGVAALVDALLLGHKSGIDAQRQGLGISDSGAQIEVLEVDSGWRDEIGELRVRAGALRGGPTPALAYLFENRGRSVVVSGTGWAPEDLISFSQGVDMLVHEAVYVPTPEDAAAAGVIADPELLLRDAALHTSILDVGHLGQRAGVSTLVLVRLRPPPFFDIQVTGVVGNTFSGSVVIPDDGDELEP